MSARADWEAKVAKEVAASGGDPELATVLPGGIRMPALPEAGTERAELPGEPPFVRGARPAGTPPRNMPRVDAADAARFRDQVRQDLRGGADALWIVDSEHRLEPIDVVSAVLQVPTEDLLVAIDLGDDPAGASPPAAVRLTAANDGWVPMANGLSRLATRFWGRHDALDASPPAGAFLNPPCKTTKSLDVAAGNPDIVVRVGDVWGDGAHGAYSTDGGSTWTPFPSEPKNAGKGGEVAISANGQTIFWSTKGSTPHFSRDRGKSWAKTVGLPEAPDTQDWVSNSLRPAFDSRDPAKAYVLDSAKGEIYVSEDGGKSFELTTKGLPALADIDRISARIVPVPGVEGDVWVSTTKDIQRSTDWGRTFAVLGTVEESLGLGFGKGPANGSYPSAYLVGKVKGVYGFFRSDDAGATWVRINDDAHQYGWVSVVTGDPRVHGRVYVGSGGRGILSGKPK